MLGVKIALWAVVGVFGVGTLIWFFTGGATSMVSEKSQTISGDRAESPPDAGAYYLGMRGRVDGSG